MRSKKRTIGILIVVIVVLLGFAGSLLVYRNKLSSEKTKNNSNNNTAQSLSSAPSGKSIENFYDKPITDEKIALDSIEANRDKLGYSDKSFTFIYDEKSSSGTAYHFDLYYKDIPVYSPVGIRGVSVITYYDNSADVLITGVSDSEKIIKVNTTPKITQDELKDIIKRQFSIEEDINSKLIVYETSEEYVLAYYIEYSFYIYIINAENGEIIDSSSMLVSNSAEYEGQNGDIHQIFYNDYDETKDIKNALWDNEKNIFIVNNRWGYELFGKKSSEGLFTTEDLKLGNNKSAIDGMANAYRAVEFFEKKFDYTFDSTYVSVNVDKDKDKKGNTKKDNACGTYAKVNDDNIAYLFFLVSSDKDKAQWTAYLDLVAHEYTHAITGSKAFGTGYSKDSKYYEKNALMEAYSDIFGELVEKEYTGSTDWKNYNLRNISEPKIKKYTKRYITEDKQGTDDNDYGGAHQNSTIISHVAYLMSKSNDSKKYDAEFLLDYNQLAQLWYGSLEYLKETEFMDFSDCRYAVEKSARKLIKEGVLLEDNLKVIEQAFNDIEVISNPARRGAMDSAEIKEKHTATVSIEDEIQSSEFVEITEILTEPNPKITDSDYNGTAYINVYDNFVTIRDEELVSEGDAYLNSQSKSVSDEYGLKLVLTYQDTLYLDKNGDFIQFDNDNDVKYCSGNYRILDNNEIDFKYEKCYLYGDKIDDFTTHIIEENVLDNDYKYDFNNGPREAYMHRLSNANEYNYMAVALSNCCGWFNELPSPGYQDYYDNLDICKFSFLGSHDNAVKPKIRDNYIIAEQKGYSFGEIFNLDEFTLQYSNFDVINNNKTDYIHRPGQKIDDLILDNIEFKFNKNKTWSITNNSDYDYYGKTTGNWELIDEHILAIICDDCYYQGSYNSDAINFLYLDFENNEIYIPLFVESPSMLPLMDRFKNSSNQSGNLEKLN